MPYFWKIQKLRINQRVKNVQGTANDKPPGKISWKKLWTKKTGCFWPSRCSRKYCPESAQVGAHVTLENGPGKCYTNAAI